MSEGGFSRLAETQEGEGGLREDREKMKRGREYGWLRCMGEGGGVAVDLSL